MDNELIKVFKKLKNTKYLGAMVGSVLEEMPNLRISLGDKIIVEKEQIYLSKHVLDTYERSFEIEGSLELEGNNFLLQATPGVINDVHIGGTRPVTSIPEGRCTRVEVKGQIKGEGKIKFVDTLKKGDMVLLIASTDNQSFFLIDKGEKL